MIKPAFLLSAICAGVVAAAAVVGVVQGVGEGGADVLQFVKLFLGGFDDCVGLFVGLREGQGCCEQQHGDEPEHFPEVFHLVYACHWYKFQN